MNWRRAYMRLVSSYIHEELHTRLDIIDASPREGEELSEQTIVIQAKMDNEELIEATRIFEVSEEIAHSLETSLKDVSFKGDFLVLTFTMEDN